MPWEFQSAAVGFESLRNRWDSLNSSVGNHVLLDSVFVSCLLRHFGDSRVLVGSSTNSDFPGMALCVRRGLGRWETFQPSQAPVGLILLGRNCRTAATLRDITRGLPGCALQLSVLQQDPDYSDFSAIGNESVLERLDYIQTARITVSDKFDEYWKERGSNLRHNLARRRRRLSEKGYTAELVEIRSADDMPSAIREYGRLESLGWKGRDGTAIAENNVQGRFYREVFEQFGDRGQAVIFQFLLNGQVAASDLCLTRDGMMVVLKTAYDEQFDDFSPAFLMREEILRRLFSTKDIRTIEFYGRVMEWHTRWSKEVRTLYHINYLRNRWVAPSKRILGRFS